MSYSQEIAKTFAVVHQVLSDYARTTEAMDALVTSLGDAQADAEGEELADMANQLEELIGDFKQSLEERMDVQNAVDILGEFMEAQGMCPEPSLINQ
jgi:hypothetical protein